jgi:serine/threonine protein kinase HipA of HipAB toxin-antitoxin module
VAWSPPSTTPADYPALAERAALGEVGASAGGERPKFGTLAGGRHVLVKFASPDRSQAARRWRDLLWCEYHALRTLERAGVAAAVATCQDVERWRFLEVERFDRTGARGRRAVVTLEAIDDEYFGFKDSWTAAAGRLRAAPFSLPESDASRLRWLDAFGQLIGNDDRHFGNIAFLVEPSGALRLAPAYDMVPMMFAPSAEKRVERPYTPRPPVTAALAEWKAAAPVALRYWRELAAERTLHESLRLRARSAAVTLEQVVRRVMPGFAIESPG